MPAIALPPPRSPVSLIWSILNDERSLPASQGVEGECVRRAAHEAAVHWTARPSCLLEVAHTEDQFTYDPVPLRVVGTVKVKYQLSGRLQPQPYSVD